MVRASVSYPDYTEERKKRRGCWSFVLLTASARGCLFSIALPCLTLAKNHPFTGNISLINDDNPVDINILNSILEQRISNFFLLLWSTILKHLMPDRRWYWAAWF